MKKLLQRYIFECLALLLIPGLLLLGQSQFSGGGGSGGAFSTLTGQLNPTTQIGTGSGAISLTAGGTNQNITLTPSGTGVTQFIGGASNGTVSFLGSQANFTNGSPAIQFSTGSATAHLSIGGPGGGQTTFSWGGALINRAKSVTATATTQIDANTGNVFEISLGVNITSFSFANPFAGQTVTLVWDQTGSFSVSGIAANIHGLTTPGTTNGDYTIQQCTYVPSAIWVCAAATTNIP